MSSSLRSKISISFALVVLLSMSLALFVSAKTLAHAINASSTQTDWPMFGFDAQHTRNNPTEAALNTSNVLGLTLDWSYTAGSYIYSSSPTVVNGIVYFGSWDKKVYALDANTGALKWSYATGQLVYSTPSVVNGIVYVGSVDGKLYALDAILGTLKWSYTTGNSITSSSPAVANGIVYIGSDDNKLYALDANTGTIIWSYTTGGSLFSPTVSNGIVFVESNGGILYALDAATGILVWNSTIGNVSSLSLSIAVANGVIYVPSGYPDNKLYALDANTGMVKWSSTSIGIFEYSSPAIANGVVYIGSENYNLYAFDANTGAVLWNYPTGFSILSSPTVINGMVYVGSDDNKIYAFNLPGTTPTPSPSPSPPSIIVNPTQGQPGTMVTVTGSSWTSGDMVDISLSTSTSVLTKATVTGDGTFSASFTVPNNAATGTQFVNAKDETTSQTAQAPFMITHAKLFVFLQGLTSSLSQNSFFQNGGIGSFLQTNFQNSSFLTFSYKGDDGHGNPQDYGCIDTFNQHIGTYVGLLNTQLQDYLANRPNTDVYLIGHSMGGVIAVGYLAGLNATGGLNGNIPGTNGDKIKGVVTLDSPLGGIVGGIDETILLHFYYEKLQQCKGLAKARHRSLDDLTKIYTGNQPRGGQASIAQVLYNTPVTNQSLLQMADQDGTTSLTIGNLIDYAYDAKACLPHYLLPPEFLDTQWDQDQGNNSGVYARAFTSGISPCPGKNDIGDNHGVVFTNQSVQSGLQQFINETTPIALQIPPN